MHMLRDRVEKIYVGFYLIAAIVGCALESRIEDHELKASHTI
jgi:hypothetical protein